MSRPLSLPNFSQICLFVLELSAMALPASDSLRVGHVAASSRKSDFDSIACVIRDSFSNYEENSRKPTATQELRA